MIVEIRNNEKWQDNFVHLKGNLLLKEGSVDDEGGIAVRLKNVDNEIEYLAWVVNMPSSSGQSSSSILPTGNYELVTRTNLPLLKKVTLLVDSLEDYEAVMACAEELIDHIFLQQARVVDDKLPVKIYLPEGRSVIFKVLEGESGGILGVDTEVEIIPPSHKSTNQNQINLRIRECSFMLQDTNEEGGGGIFMLCNPGERLQGLWLLNEKWKVEIIAVDHDYILPGWLYSLPSTMQKLKLRQHQWTSIQKLPIQKELHSKLVDVIFNPENDALERNQSIVDMLERFYFIKPSRNIVIRGGVGKGKSTYASQYVKFGNVPSIIVDLQLISMETSLLKKKYLLLKAFESENVLECIPGIIFIDHAEQLVCSQDQDNINPEENFLLHQILILFNEVINYLTKVRGCNVVLLLQNDCKLSQSLLKTDLWIHEINLISRPEVNLLSAKVPKFINLLSWNDIPGIDYLKQQIEDILLRPLLQPNFFMAHGLKKPSGVLLSAPTGMGKSLIIRSLSQHLHQNLDFHEIFMICGASLLNKYVGGSEKAVRELFQQARASPKGALIIIEELDALASKRGSDHTGTIDRVVNQLLTEIDGVEERGNVHILATTSRIERIDPAVIRSGRMDIHLRLSYSPEDIFQVFLHYLCQISDKAKNLGPMLFDKIKMCTPADIYGAFNGLDEMEENELYTHLSRYFEEVEMGAKEGNLINQSNPSKQTITYA